MRPMIFLSLVSVAIVHWTPASPLPVSHVQSGRDKASNDSACPFVVDRGSCPGAKDECKFDGDCSRGIGATICCYDGCAMTCTERSKPPPVIDWLVEPKPEGNSRYFWLTDEVRYDNMQGDQDKGLKEREDPGGDCTAPTLSDYDHQPPPNDNLRRVCPDGYECILFDMGDSERGIPGRGWCRMIRKDVL